MELKKHHENITAGCMAMLDYSSLFPSAILNCGLVRNAQFGLKRTLIMKVHDVKTTWISFWSESSFDVRHPRRMRFIGGMQTSKRDWSMDYGLYRQSSLHIYLTISMQGNQGPRFTLSTTFTPVCPRCGQTHTVINDHLISGFIIT